MPKLDLRNALRIKTAAGEVSRLKWQGGVWPSGGAVLADFYGVGSGLVPMHIKLSDPAMLTLDGNIVTAAPNIGGAGPAFNLTAPAGREPTWTGDHVTFAPALSTTSSKVLRLATSADLVGVHAFFPVIVPSFTGRRHILGEDGDYRKATGFRITGASTSAKQVNILEDRTSYYTTSSFDVSLDEWALFEVRVQGSLWTIWKDGAQIDSRDVALLGPAFLIDTIGAARNETGWGGAIGDVVSVICDPAHSHSNPEPAVLVARQTLAAQYGISLT